jgi:hypothetical protein
MSDGGNMSKITELDRLAQTVGIGVLSVVASLQLSICGAVAEPSVKITTDSGFPQLAINATETSCGEPGMNSGTRQAVLNAAAREWAAFEFPRFSLSTESNYAIIPPGISAKQSDTSSNGPAPRLVALGAMEDDSSVRERIGRYWASIGEGHKSVFAAQNVLWKASDGRAGWAEYWSAAFVSYVMCKAALSNDHFLRAASHRDCITAAIEKREGSRPNYAFRAQDLSEATPRPGDIICAARDDGDQTINSISDFKAQSSHSAYHCDIVMGFDTDDDKPGVLYAIGGNVLNAVTMTETPLSNKRLVPVKAPHARNWFVILKYVGPEGPASFRKVPNEVIAAARKIRDARAKKQ